MRAFQAYAVLLLAWPLAASLCGCAKREGESRPDRATYSASANEQPKPQTFGESETEVEATGKIPIIYSTDLFQPHGDPDDHFDLATLFAMEEFEVLGIILEHGEKQSQRPGRIPVRQMIHMTGREIPWVVGLSPRRSADDDGRDQPEEYQKGVELILDALRTSRRKVTIFTAGSMRDVAAALNREPKLMHEKVHRLYMNIGNTSGQKIEWNVKMDPAAYADVLQSGLPVYWCPCIGDPYSTHWRFRQGDVLDGAPAALQNFFVFALTTGSRWNATPAPPVDDPLGFLSQGSDARARREVWQVNRSMWCTAPLFHAAGRRVVEVAPGQWEARPAAETGGTEVELFDFAPGRVEIDDQGSTTFREGGELGESDVIRTFRKLDPPRFHEIMTCCLRRLFEEMPLGDNLE